RVPTGQDVRIEVMYPLAESGEGCTLVSASNSLLRHGSVATVDDQNLIATHAVECDGQQPLRLRVGLDIERQHAWLDPQLRGPQYGVVENARHSDSAGGASCCDTLDLAGSLDSVLNEVPDRKANVRFERVHPIRVQAVAQSRHVRRYAHIDPGNR